MKDSLATKWSVVLVVILKNESAYLSDWLTYHSGLGFEHIFVYDNGSTDEIHRALGKFIAGGLVTYLFWPLRAGQIDAYNHARRLFGSASEWMCFIDVDEYVVLHEHDDIFSYLNSMNADQVLVPWRNFPYGGHRLAPGGSDVENYFWAHKSRPDLTVQVKHMVRSSAALHTTAHFSLINSDRTAIGDGTPSRPTHFVQGPSYRGAQINHYATRSFIENVARLEKGQVDGGAEKQLAEFRPLTAESASQLDYDPSALRHFERFAAERGRWDLMQSIPHRFGLMQRNAVLTSWNNLPFFFSKSFSNYLLGVTAIAHGTNANPIMVDQEGREHELRRFWHDADLYSIYFRVDNDSFQRSFMGSIHYGDFARRFAFSASEIVRDKTVDSTETFKFPLDAHCFAAIFDIQSEKGVKIRATTDDREIKVLRIPPGRHAGLIYDPKYSFRAEASVQIVGDSKVREMILGRLP